LQQEVLNGRLFIFDGYKKSGKESKAVELHFTAFEMEGEFNIQRWIKPMQIVNGPRIKSLCSIDYFSPMHKDLVETEQNRKRKRKEEERQIEEEKQFTEESLKVNKENKAPLEKQGKYREYTKESKETAIKYAKLHGAAKAARRFASHNNEQGIPERTSNTHYFILRM
jgi:hypothetical protein